MIKNVVTGQQRQLLFFLWHKPLEEALGDAVEERKPLLPLQIEVCNGSNQKAAMPPVKEDSLEGGGIP